MTQYSNSNNTCIQEKKACYTKMKNIDEVKSIDSPSEWKANRCAQIWDKCDMGRTFPLHREITKNNLLYFSLLGNKMLVTINKWSKKSHKTENSVEKVLVKR